MELTTESKKRDGILVDAVIYGPHDFLSKEFVLFIILWIYPPPVARFYQTNDRGNYDFESGCTTWKNELIWSIILWSFALLLEAFSAFQRNKTGDLEDSGYSGVGIIIPTLAAAGAIGNENH